MALFLEIYLSVIGLCKLAAVLVRLFNVLNLAVIFLVECEGKDLWQWVQCRRHGTLLEEETAAKPTCQSFHVKLRHCNLVTGSTCAVPS